MGVSLSRYFNYILNHGWDSKTILGNWRLSEAAKATEAGRFLIKFAESAANESDAYLIGVFADQNALINKDLPWRVFAPFWVRDEARHAEAFFRILIAANVDRPGDWFNKLKTEHSRLGEYRANVYDSLDVFRDPLHFWAALALDEWNTTREIAALAHLVNGELGEAPATLLKRVAADEAQHFEYALAALARFPLTEAEMALGHVLGWVDEIEISSDRFMFDHEPVPGSTYSPDYQKTVDSILSRLRKSHA